MKQSDMKTALYNRIQKANQKGSGYVLGKGYNASWFKALKELKESKKVAIRGGKLFATKRPSKMG